MNRIKELRKQRKLSQRALSEQIGVNIRTVQRWERGEGAMKPPTAEGVANFFGVGVGYLLGYSQKPDIPEKEDLQLSKRQYYILKLISIKACLLREQEEISAQDLSDIKKEARGLYEDLVWMQFEAEEREGK
ncbi:helix-turn-helix domain-containing protein [Streptococcus parasanguinis]|uniref:helix-turn-helix domain-containing protein n=1 Tax=Streptococcus parasanguinis TaxID=1318 RepID=UPI0012BCB0CF|nr:helix-turn-helix transcriptional regulator [Streptococcus parasanguinis]DAS60011.1 MAG TPA: helix-turn-helix domain protein [Caudoviricetes sp.]MTR54193.1 helix-turn-helix domain-containing protein [Streptococcus parasanguinis]MTR56133.1 helix-turn-helix domain-containing protein [Streptococcus parasanguinis]MTR60765.1 helix-turn-helix domain-containing protein [Streptococcus parasanguinis]MTR69984.1 helix-turn-helix domain-containing protein [Streptococcus parasanguinis]